MVQVNTGRPSQRTKARAERRRAERAARRQAETPQELPSSSRSPLKSVFGTDGGKWGPLLHKGTVLFAVVAPFLATHFAIDQLWNWAVTWPDLVLLLVMYVPISLGVTAGFHRMLTHRSFQAHPIVAGDHPDLRLDGGRGRGDHLGRQPPQAPRPGRQAGRPAQPGRWAVPRSPRLAVRR